MKVIIGPYEPWWASHVHTDYMNKKHNYDWEKSTTLFEKFLEKLEDFLNNVYYYTANQIFKRKKRKIKVKIHHYDTWGMDNTLAYIILPMLKQLKATKHGSPYVDHEDIPEHLRLSEREEKVFNEGYWNKELNATEEEIKAASDKFHSQWNWVIDQMIWSFEQELGEDADYKNYYDPYLPGELEQEEQEGVVDSLFDKKFRMKMGKFNNDKYKAYQERKQLGFTLFGKYYQALWD